MSLTVEQFIPPEINQTQYFPYLFFKSPALFTMNFASYSLFNAFLQFFEMSFFCLLGCFFFCDFFSLKLQNLAFFSGICSLALGGRDICFLRVNVFCRFKIVDFTSKRVSNDDIRMQRNL